METCLQASILSLPEAVACSRLRKGLLHQEEKSIPVSCDTGQGIAARIWPVTAGLGIRRVLAPTTTSVKHSSDLSTFLVLLGILFYK